MFQQTDVDIKQHERALGILENVTLDHFKREPATISPFGSSLLSWKVNGPVEVRIDFEWGLPTMGSMRVQPKSSHNYRLYAYVDADSKFLGSVIVNVNLSQCIYRDNPAVGQILKFGLQREIDEDPNVYFRSAPEIIVTPGQIRFILKLESPINNFPNAEIDIDASFGLDVVNDPILAFRRKVVPVNININVNVSVAWYAWLIPGAMVILPIALGMAEDQVRQKIRASIPRLVDEGILNFVTPDGMELHSVQIGEGGIQNKGNVEFTFCPKEIPPIIDV